MRAQHIEDEQHSAETWSRLRRVTEPALALAPGAFLNDLRANQAARGLSQAVAARNTASIFDWIMGLLPLQGISDRIATRFAEQHGIATYAEIRAALNEAPGCPRLRSYWHFEECGYRKVGRTCAEPDHLAACPLPILPLRKGSLNQATFSLALFIRDVCDGDLVGWIDERLAQVDPGLRSPDRGRRLREAILGPLCEVYGIGSKLWAMILADLLLGADPVRERWLTSCASPAPRPPCSGRRPETA